MSVGKRRKIDESSGQRSIEKSALLAAIARTYDDTRFLIQKVVEPEGDFKKGLCLNKSSFVSKGELLKQVNRTESISFFTMPGFPDNLVLDLKTSLWLGSIERNQFFDTEVPRGYNHIAAKCDHWDVYYKIDHVKKTISVLLGAYQKELKLKEYTDFVWKPGKAMMYCASSASLEKTLQDPFWSDQAVRVLRHAVGIPKII